MAYGSEIKIENGELVFRTFSYDSDGGTYIESESHLPLADLKEALQSMSLLKKPEFPDLKNQHEKLWDLCKQFVKDNQIGCPETVSQSDHVIVNAYVFIERICDIVGYHVE